MVRHLKYLASVLRYELFFFMKLFNVVGEFRE